jgi:hypothetical protein
MSQEFLPRQDFLVFLAIRQEATNDHFFRMRRYPVPPGQIFTPDTPDSVLFKVIPPLE